VTHPKTLASFVNLSLLAALTALLGACSSTPIAAPAPATKSATPMAAAAPTERMAAPAPTGANAKPPAASTITAVAVPAYLDPKSEIATGRSVYFDFDAAVLKPEFSSLIERHGKYLIANPKVAVKIEGNCDERGSAEYNLALGQKRAESVRQSLKVYGVKDTQLEAVSWGSEKPKAQGHDESAWAQNRRADVQYPGR
jgi:peptidoglycan-associated lipoprotein